LISVNSANLAGAAVTFTGLQIDGTTPSVTSVASSQGTFQASGVVTITLNLNEAVTVSIIRPPSAGPTLTLNDGGTAVYDAALSTATALVFTYTVGASNTTTSAPAITSVNLNGFTVQDAAGNPANLSGALTTLSGTYINIAFNGNDTVNTGNNSTISLGAGIDTVTAGTNSTISVGNGNDSISAGSGSIISAGDGVDNVTVAGGGTVALGGGNDTVSVGSGSVSAGNGVDNVTISGGGTVALGTGNDTVSIGSGSVSAGNGVDNVTISGGGTVALGTGNDKVSIGSGSILVGNGVDNVTISGGGTVALGAGNDTVSIGSGSVSGGNGVDNVTVSGGGAVTLGNGNDTVTAGAGSVITTGNGNDSINVGANSTVTLGTGADTVAFGVSPNSTPIGQEAVNNFNAHTDVINFNHALFANYAAVLADSKQVGQNTVITADTNDSVTLHNVALSSLSASNFHFS